ARKSVGRELLVMRVGHDAKRYVAALELARLAGARLVDDGGVVPGAGPADGARVGVDQKEGKGHEAVQAVVHREDLVGAGHEVGQAAVAQGAGAEGGADGGHDQGRGDAVAHDVPHCYEERGRGDRGDVDEVVVVAAGFVAVLAAPGDVEPRGDGV